jgi:saccharopine dehydrogenase-like NADP-dependent oxidoreductase
VVADDDLARAEAVVAKVGDPRFTAARVDAADGAGVADLLREHRIDALLNATDPRFVMPLFRACPAARVTYLDMAMSMSDAAAGRMLGDEQFASAGEFEAAGVLALVGIGVEPGLSDVLARYAADHLFSEVHTLDVRDGGNLAVPGRGFAPPFSIWTLIEECLNPPVVWERERGWFTTEPFSEPEVFDFRDRPAGVRERGARGGAPHAPPARGAAGHLQVRARRRGDRRAADPSRARPGRRPRAVYLHHVVDNDRSMAEYGCQAVVWQTGVNPVVALELVATGAWRGAGVLGPEAFDAVPFLDLLTAYGSPWALREDQAP